MKKALSSLILILVLGSLAFYGQAKFGLFIKPCSRTIGYSLGSYDNRFKISQAEFLEQVEEAIAVWEDKAGLDLFAYSPTGKLKINLIYDYRQEATDRLKSLGYTIDDTQASYESLKQRYNVMVLDYNRLKDSLEQKVADYNRRKDAYEKEVADWNKKGGAPKQTVSKLNAEKDALNILANQINRDQTILNTLASDINAVVDLLNRMASNLNISVSDYNKIGSTRGEEFEEGAYISTGRSQQIDIYEFESEARLVRLLAHEFGHALGLEHIEDRTAIMYRLNQASTSVASAADVAQLKELCGL